MKAALKTTRHEVLSVVSFKHVIRRGKRNETVSARRLTLTCGHELIRRFSQGVPNKAMCVACMKEV